MDWVVTSCTIAHHEVMHAFTNACPTERSSMLFSEQALRCLLELLDKEVSEHSRHLVQYFQVFSSYAHRGAFEVSA